MIRKLSILSAICGVIAICAGSGTARAQHIDVLVLQAAGRLVTGKGDFDNNQWAAGQRVYSRRFDSDYLVNNPGFNALGSNSALLPPGSQALPPVTNLSWDFLPMQVGNRLANLLYWDGLESDGQPGLTANDVKFGPTPGSNYTLIMFDKNSQPFAVRGSDAALVTGGVIARTDATGSLHQHNYIQLDDGSGYRGTSPADGIYLWALDLRMPGLESSLPFYMLFDTLSSPSGTLSTAALPWVEEQLDLPGDYTGDGVVDAADYCAWRDTLNQTGAGLAADGSGDQVVNAEDYALWKQHFGAAAVLQIAATAGIGSLAATVGDGAPEPNSLWLLLLGSQEMFGNAMRWRGRDLRRRAPTSA
jgi:hypothetical protein